MNNGRKKLHNIKQSTCCIYIEFIKACSFPIIISPWKRTYVVLQLKTCFPFTQECFVRSLQLVNIGSVVPEKMEMWKLYRQIYIRQMNDRRSESLTGGSSSGQLKRHEFFFPFKICMLTIYFLDFTYIISSY